MDHNEDELLSDIDDYADDVPEAYDLFNDEADEAEEAERLSDNDRDRDDNEEGQKVDKTNVKEEEKKSKPKRVVKNPRVTLNFDTLRGPNGLSALKKLFTNFKYKGDKHEEEDLTKIIGILQQWMCYKLNPSYDFESTLTQLEILGKKKIVQTLMKKYRLGMDDWGENKSDEDDKQTPDNQQMIVDNTNDFEKELQLEIANADSDVEFSPEEDNGNSQVENNYAVQTQVVLTQEQLDRIARNRKLAEERRMKRLSSQQKMDVVEENQNTSEIPLDKMNLEEHN